jgi:hypothetical protein
MASGYKLQASGGLGFTTAFFVGWDGEAAGHWCVLFLKYSRHLHLRFFDRFMSSIGLKPDFINGFE